MSGIYLVRWMQSGAYQLCAVVTADIQEQAIEAVGHMYQPTNIEAIRVGELDPACGISAPTVLAQESL